jgi:hypothetical protein
VVMSVGFSIVDMTNVNCFFWGLSDFLKLVNPG